MAGKAAQEPTKTAPVADMGADEGTKRKEASSYRVELARSGRSTCTACKKNIAKDEIRLGSGSKVERNHSSLSWRHMACVTAKQVAALEETYASDDYAKVVPGMDELPEDARKAAVDALAKSKSSGAQEAATEAKGAAAEAKEAAATEAKGAAATEAQGAAATEAKGAAATEAKGAETAGAIEGAGEEAKVSEAAEKGGLGEVKESAPSQPSAEKTTPAAIKGGRGAKAAAAKVEKEKVEKEKAEEEKEVLARAEEAAKAEGATKEVEVAEKEAKEEEGGVEASAGAEAAAGGTEAEAKKERAEAPAGEVKEAGGAEEGHANAEEKAKAKAEEHASKPATRGKRKSDSGAHPAVTKENWKAELAKGELSHHNINELKEVLGSLGLPRSGKKEVLLERLKEAANY